MEYNICESGSWRKMGVAGGGPGGWPEGCEVVYRDTMKRGHDEDSEHNLVIDSDKPGLAFVPIVFDPVCRRLILMRTASKTWWWTGSRPA